MSPRSIIVFSHAEIAVSLAFGSAALLILGIQPILLGELVSSGHVDLDGVGLIAMAEIISIGIGVGIASSVFPLNRFRWIAMATSLLLSTTNLVSSQSSGLNDLIAFRVVAGLAAGVLVWVTTSLIVRVQHPERIAGVFLAFQTLAQALLAALLALVIVPIGGWSGGFGAMAIVVLLPSLFVMYLPAAMDSLTEQSSPQPPLRLVVILASLVVVFQMAVVGSLWTFIEPIGVAAGIASQSVQLVVSLTLIMQAVGAGVAALVATRLEPRSTLICGGILQCMIAAYLGYYLGAQLIALVVACSMFGFLWLFMMTFHVRLAFLLEPTGRLALFGPSLQLLGSALGPLAASLVVQADSARPAAATSATFAAISVGLLLVLIMIPSRSPVITTALR